MGRNLWQTLEQKVTNGPMALSVFIAGLAAFILSIVLSAHDFYSSLEGLISLQDAFRMQETAWPIALYFMAAAPQVGQVVFLALWSLDTERKWALGAALFWFIGDFASDVQYWSAATLFPMDGMVRGDPSTLLVSSLFTLAYFTIGAELFMIAGSAIILTLYPEAKRQWRRLWKEFRSDGGGSSKPSNQQRPSSPSGGASQPPSMLTDISFNEPPRNNRPQGREARQRQGQRNGTP
jgi:hypothetical protein